MEELFKTLAFILPSVFLFMCTQYYRRKHKEITSAIYGHITFLLLFIATVLAIGFSILENIVTSFAYLLLIPITHAIISIIGTSYILKKYFKCTAWIAHILFGLFTLSLFYISILLFLMLTALFAPLL